jgi:hypothetical protein
VVLHASLDKLLGNRSTASFGSLEEREKDLCRTGTGLSRSEEVAENPTKGSRAWKEPVVLL